MEDIEIPEALYDRDAMSHSARQQLDNDYVMGSTCRVLSWKSDDRTNPYNSSSDH